MATVAQLNWTDYAALIFDKYNERFEGKYPNLKYKCDIRCRYIGRNGGTFSIYASNTFRFGNLSKTYTLSYTKSTSSAWYSLGTLTENMGCNRSKSWEYSCSSGGFPNLSGKGTVTTPTIALPNLSFSVEKDKTTQTSITVNGKLTSNPYNLYVLRLYNPDKSTWWTSNLNGEKTFNELTQNTTYKFHPEVWLATLSGNKLKESSTVSETTLENYPEITIEDIDIQVTSGETKDTVTFTVKTSDDSHVQQSIWTIGTQSTELGLTHTEELDKNQSLTVKVSVRDTLGRTSAEFSKGFETTFTFKEVYVFDNGVWKRGYSYVLQNGEYKLCELWACNGTEWLQAPKYQ